MLFDSFGRKHDYLRISITDRCNFRCTYCMPDNRPGAYPETAGKMSPSEIEGIARVFCSLGVTKLRITGGEPLVRRDAGEIINRLSALPVKLTLTTNGVYLDRFMQEIRDAGIRSVNVSLDAMDAETFRIIAQRDQFDKVMMNIRSLLEAGIHVKVNMVVMKAENEQQVTEFVAWTEKLPLHVRFIEYMPFTRNEWNYSKVVSAEEIRRNIALKYKFSKLNDLPNDTAKSYAVDGFMGTFALISTMTEPFCGSCNRLRLTADGKMKNCLFSKGEMDLLSAYRKGENLEDLIRSCLWEKKAARGGQMNGPMESLDAGSIENRSMIAIGG